MIDENTLAVVFYNDRGEEIEVHEIKEYFKEHFVAHGLRFSYSGKCLGRKSSFNGFIYIDPITKDRCDYSDIVSYCEPFDEELLIPKYRNHYVHIDKDDHLIDIIELLRESYNSVPLYNAKVERIDENILVLYYYSPETYEEYTKRAIVSPRIKKSLENENRLKIEQEISKHELEAEKLRNKLKGMTND